MIGGWWPLWFRFSARRKYHAIAGDASLTFCHCWTRGIEKTAYAGPIHPPEKARCKICYKELVRRFQLDTDWAHIHPEWRPEQPAPVEDSDEG